MSTAVSRRHFVAAAAATAATATLNSTRIATASEKTVATAVPSWLGEEPQTEDPTKILETEVLIIGAGNGGMAAAATAAQLGVDFLLAEAFDDVNDTRHWVGAVNSKYTAEAGAQVDVPRLQYELARYASFKCNQRLQKMWIDESAEMVEWVGSIQEPVGYICRVDTNLGDEMSVTAPTGSYIPPQEHMFLNPETMSSRGERPDRNHLMRQIVEDAGHEILWDHTLVRLVHDNGAVTGAIFETGDGIVQINAQHVILATGGYPGNPEMVKACAPIVPECVVAPQYSPKDRGQGIKAALWAGAAKDTEAAPMIFNRGLIEPGAVCGYIENDGQPHFPGVTNQFLGSQPFMKVGADGRRFANESCPYDFICFAAAQHPGGVWAQIFDAHMIEDINRFNTAGCSRMTQTMINNGKTFDENYAANLENGLLFKADSLEELADKLGFTGTAKDNFLAQADHYNNIYDTQFDDEFGKEPYRLSELRTPPFYGGWYGGNLLTTCDGLRINEEMQVLDANAQVIDGLYAIGDCSGSFFSGNYPEYLVGVAVGRTITQGRHVIRRIAGDL